MVKLEDFFYACHEDDFSFLWGRWSWTGIAFLIIRKNKAIKFKFYVPRIQDVKMPKCGTPQWKCQRNREKISRKLETLFLSWRASQTSQRIGNHDFRSERKWKINLLIMHNIRKRLPWKPLITLHSNDLVVIIFRNTNFFINKICEYNYMLFFFF